MIFYSLFKNDSLILTIYDAIWTVKIHYFVAEQAEKKKLTQLKQKGQTTTKYNFAMNHINVSGSIKKLKQY